jgi:hypothetical protein
VNLCFDDDHPHLHACRQTPLKKAMEDLSGAAQIPSIKDLDNTVAMLEQSLKRTQDSSKQIMSDQVRLGDEFASVFTKKLDGFCELAGNKVSNLRLHYDDAAQHFTVRSLVFLRIFSVSLVCRAAAWLSLADTILRAVVGMAPPIL